VFSEDGRGTSARIEIVEAARGVMQLAGRSGDVHSWRQSGRHMLVWSFSAFDPNRTSTPPKIFNSTGGDRVTRSTRLHVFVQHHQHPGHKQKHRGNNGMPPKHEGHPKDCNDESNQCHPAISK
jgi:hypothetical protein